MREWSIPVFIDSANNFDEALVLRCTYFFIDIDEATAAPIGEPQTLDRPAIIMGGREIIMAPSQRNPLFSSSEVIKEFFEDVEKEEYQSVEIGVLWIPLAQDPKDFSKEDIVKLRGQVIRLPQELYKKCYMYTLNRITLKELLDGLTNVNVFDFLSPRETKAFSEWMARQIDDSRKRVHDPNEENYRVLKSEKKTRKPK